MRPAPVSAAPGEPPHFVDDVRSPRFPALGRGEPLRALLHAAVGGTFVLALTGAQCRPFEAPPPSSTSRSDLASTAPAASPDNDATRAPAPATTPAPVPAPAPGSIVAHDAALATADERNSVDVFGRAAPATVFVTQSELVRDPFSARAMEVPSGTGTGFIWDKKGHIITNYHVILGGGRGQKRLSVTLHNQKTYPVKAIATYEDKDIAVLTIDAPAEELVPIALPGKDEELQVGQKAIAIGNPFGLDHSLTTGVVSALGREVDGVNGVKIRDMIQTDAAINPGNSGGPLLDSRGRLIGMNTMIFSKSGTSAGIGFAVPVQTIMAAVPGLIATGQAPRVGLGISLLPTQLSRRLGLPGAVVWEVPAGSPAHKAGLRGIRLTKPQEPEIGDVIVGVNDQPVRSPNELVSALASYEVGREVTLVVSRGKTLHKLTVPLVDVRQR